MKVLVPKKDIQINYDNIKMWYYDTFIYDWYRHLFHRIPERFSRACAFFKMGWMNHDFDDHYLHEVVLFKLKRLQYCFIHYGYHAETCHNYKPKMKSLALAIKLMDRVCNYEYNDFYDRHREKWGRPSFRSIPVDVEGNEVPRAEAKFFRMDTKSPKATTPELEEQERKEFKAAYEADERLKTRDLRIAYNIIAKYSPYWWD